MRLTVRDVQRMKGQGERIALVTAYDYTSAQLVERAGLPAILVGDTLGMVVLGYETTVPVTLDDMLHHCRAVARGSRRALLIGDLSFLTYPHPEAALRNAGRLLQEGGLQAVKLEGGAAMAPVVRGLVGAGVSVMGHIGFTPQSVHTLGVRVQGRGAEGARRLVADALALQGAGAFALLLESVPAELARAITARLRIPTIGIGAGPGCDGQVQVWHDLLGLYTDFVPRHARRTAALADLAAEALGRYAGDVRAGTFPTADQSASMGDEALRAALAGLDGAAPADVGARGG